MGDREYGGEERPKRQKESIEEYARWRRVWTWSLR